MDEYIKREEAVKKIKSCIFTAEDAWESGYNTAMADIMEWIKHMPSADVQPVKHGRCVIDNEGYERCSICNEHESGMRYFAFCPRCGARLDSKDGDIDGKD